MRIGDVITIKIKKHGTSYAKAIEADWFELMGYTQKELETGEIDICIMAAHSKKHGQDYIALFKPK